MSGTLGSLDDDRAAVVRRDRSDRRSTRAPARFSTPTSASIRFASAIAGFQRVEQIREPSAIAGFRQASEYLCQADEYAAQELGFAMDLLEARGDIDPDGPEAEDFVLNDLKEVVMHEVGHTLGLRHNFRASTVYAQKDLDDPAFTKTHGIAGSVMEYNAINIAAKGAKQGAFSMATLGPYDYWAVEYGYKEVPQDREVAELKTIAARSSEPVACVRDRRGRRVRHRSGGQPSRPRQRSA
jgi:hypothetical protein